MSNGKHWSSRKKECATPAPVHPVVWFVVDTEGNVVGSTSPHRRWIDARTEARQLYGEAVDVLPLGESPPQEDPL